MVRVRRASGLRELCTSIECFSSFHFVDCYAEATQNNIGLYKTPKTVVKEVKQGAKGTEASTRGKYGTFWA